jgi:quaternary ammonium compound-resistance protein SugE
MIAMDWLLLVGAGLAEVGFTTMIKLSEGFKRLIPALLFFVFAPVSFWLLSTAMQTIPLGTAYAVWTSIGAVGTALMGIVLFGESANFGRIALLLIMVGAVVGLKLIESSTNETAKPQPASGSEARRSA